MHVFSNSQGSFVGCVVYALDHTLPLYHDPHGAPVGCLVMGHCPDLDVFTVNAHEFSPETEDIYCKLAQDQRKLCAHQFCEHFAQMPDDAKAMTIAGFANLLDVRG